MILGTSGTLAPAMLSLYMNMNHSVKLKILFYLSLMGWILTVLIQLITLFHIDVYGSDWLTIVLGMGVFAVYIPLVMKTYAMEKAKGKSKSSDLNHPYDFIKKYSPHVPLWMIRLFIGTSIYAFCTFAFFLITNKGIPYHEGNKFVLKNHGHTVKALTEEDYHYYRSDQLRGTSAHWLVFYGIAIAFYFPFGRGNE